MLYKEFLSGTGAPQNDPRTHLQYKAIEQIYMLSETMSKTDAYKLWRSTFGKELKLEIAKIRALDDAIIAQDDSEETQKAALHKIVRCHAKADDINRPVGDVLYIDEAGYLWFVCCDYKLHNAQTLYQLYHLTRQGQCINCHFAVTTNNLDNALRIALA